MSSMLTILALADAAPRKNRLAKFNDNHDEQGRFASGSGGSEESNRATISSKANLASKDARSAERQAMNSLAEHSSKPSDEKALMAITRLGNAAHDHDAAASAHHTASGFYRYASSQKLVDTKSADAHTKAALGHGNAAERLRSKAEAVYNEHFGVKAKR